MVDPFRSMSLLAHKDALSLVAQGIAQVVGPRSEAHRDLIKALQSNTPMDMMLAQASFDALPGQKRREISDAVNALVQKVLGEPPTKAGGA